MRCRDGLAAVAIHVLTLNGADDVLPWIAWHIPTKGATVDLSVDATRARLLDAMKDSVVAKAAYAGRFRQ